ncbi:GntR family transcriptional regulator [Bauldia sp.]|uniref:GntR family transcriptional regulator n=1 Tax=Bauldia sp. TaxID=2575872 RepID=UPI003BAAB716
MVMAIAQAKMNQKEMLGMSFQSSERGLNQDSVASAIVTERLRHDIIMGVFQPAQRLRLAELKARYDIGSSPIREALSCLAAQQMVVQEPNRGFAVPDISTIELDDITNLRGQLESSAVAQSVRHGDETWEERLILSRRRLKRLGPAEDVISETSSAESVQQWEKHHREFHRALIGACPSEWTRRFCDTLNDQFDRYRRLSPPARDVQAGLDKQHDALLEVALDRDAKTCKTLMADHIRITGVAVMTGLKSKLGA